jgi:hypothetical protein
MDNLIDKINNSNLPLIHGLGKLIFYDEDLDKIIIDRCDESITEDIANQYEEFCKKNDIPISKTLVLHSNVILEREYSYSFDYFFIECKRLLNRSPDYGKIDYNIKKEKIYNCLNHSENKHRTIIFNGLKSRKLLKYGFVSYLDKGVYLPRNIEDSQTEKDDWRWPTLIPEVVSKTYFNVVTETHHNIEKDFDDLFITEKICKALITQPFIVIGNYGTLRHVKKLGFETYPELFDESYDLIENPKDRLEFILDEIERLCNMDKNELEKIYKSVVWKIEHNRKIMVDFEEDEFVSKIGGDEINYAV